MTTKYECNSPEMLEALEALEAIMAISEDINIEVEIAGSWIWVGGDTKPYKDIIKSAGYFWASKKKKWYWKPAGKRSFGRGKYTMNEIREMHGSTRLA